MCAVSAGMTGLILSRTQSAGQNARLSMPSKTWQQSIIYRLMDDLSEVVRANGLIKPCRH
jgi:hypothetical protein